MDADVWDVDAQGVPHHLGVLDHYSAVIWYLGDNRLTQDPEDELTEFGGAEVPDAAVAERQQYLTIAVRDYLNEGGKLVYAGETSLPPSFRKSRTAIVRYCCRSATERSGTSSEQYVSVSTSSGSCVSRLSPRYQSTAS